jgi:hypothetical protein
MSRLLKRLLFLVLRVLYSRRPGREAASFWLRKRQPSNPWEGI